MVRSQKQLNKYKFSDIVLRDNEVKINTGFFGKYSIMLMLGCFCVQPRFSVSSLVSSAFLVLRLNYCLEL